MSSERRVELETMGEHNAEQWLRRYPRASRRYTRRLLDGDSKADLKRELDEVGGWHGLLRSSFPGIVDDSACYSDQGCAVRHDERFVWSVGFERRLIEIVVEGLR